MIRILTVCLGNICRSPIGEAVLRLACEQEGINCFVDSCGTANYHIGKAPDARMIATAKANGVDISQLKARQFSTKDFNNFDLILTMDDHNYQDVISLCRTREDSAKVYSFQAFAGVDQPSFVPDPYYGTAKDFEETLAIVTHSAQLIAQKLKTTQHG